MRSLLEKKILRVLALAAVLTAAFAFFTFAAEANYEHDPRRCWNTMKDVEYDPAAIYGYRPAAVKESNLKKYGNENGPTADSLYAQKGSWEAVLAGAFSSNPGMDAVLGLYDDSYEFNTKVGAVSEEDPVIYVVRKKDTLCSIAKKYFGSDDCNALFRANRNVITDPDVIREGQKLVIPLG